MTSHFKRKHQISEKMYLLVASLNLCPQIPRMCTLSTVLLRVVHWKAWHLHFNMKPNKYLSSIEISEENIAQNSSTYSLKNPAGGKERKNCQWTMILGGRDNILSLKKNTHYFLEIVFKRNYRKTFTLMWKTA